MLARLSKSSSLSWSRTSSGAVRISSSATTCGKRFSCTLLSLSLMPQSKSTRLICCPATSSIHAWLQCAMHFSSLALTSSPAMSNNRSSSLDGECKPVKRSFCKASPTHAMLPQNYEPEARFLRTSSHGTLLWQVAKGISAEWNKNAHLWFAHCIEFSAEKK